MSSPKGTNRVFRTAWAADGVFCTVWAEDGVLRILMARFAALYFRCITPHPQPTWADML